MHVDGNGPQSSPLERWWTTSCLHTCINIHCDVTNACLWSSYITMQIRAYSEHSIRYTRLQRVLVSISSIIKQRETHKLSLWCRISLFIIENNMGNFIYSGHSCMKYRNEKYFQYSEHCKHKKHVWRPYLGCNEATQWKWYVHIGGAWCNTYLYWCYYHLM